MVETSSAPILPIDELALVNGDPIEMEAAGHIVMPNIFKPAPTGDRGETVPDGGYRNYIFFPAIMSPTIKYSLTVWNRWGIQIYHSDDPQKGWTGYYKGQLCPEDLYIYRIEGVFDNGQAFMEIGDVMLQR